MSAVRAEPWRPGSHEIRVVCGWEDDVHQLRRPYRSGGANESSLIEAQRSLAASGSGREADVAAFDRAPFWRPIEVGRDRFEPRGGNLAPRPEGRTVMYWWRRRGSQRIQTARRSVRAAPQPIGTHTA
ncbi:CPCC family cysteine-rich protein [Actinoplanes regularis]|uniref:CPCC family cysteine-rich protein n=1 Tax=Actinoplanes regularis TaxID=52697 RepID=UPI003D7F552D|nr:hypothetical protein Areg01_06030 [Actinoplanes regularis]